MLSAWATRNRVVLAQVKTEEKSNEITAIPWLLKLLHIKGCLATIDATGGMPKDITKDKRPAQNKQIAAPIQVRGIRSLSS